MEQRRQRRQRIGARCRNLARNVDLYASDAAQRELHLHRTIRKTCIYARQDAAKTLRRLRHGQSGQGHGPYVRDENLAVGRYCALDRHLRVAPHVYYNLIARAENIVVGGGDTQIGLERKLLVGEHVMTEDTCAAIRLVRNNICHRCRIRSQRIWDYNDRPLRLITLRYAQRCRIDLTRPVYVICRLLGLKLVYLTLRQSTVPVGLDKLLSALRLCGYGYGRRHQQRQNRLSHIM